jgi:3-hydroxybutyryl-CoA dehydratase
VQLYKNRELKVKVAELHEGTNLPELQKRITQEKINLYAEVSQDFNPIHIDPEFARQTPIGGTIAHGMLVLSYISQMMTDAFGYHWISGGVLDIRFKAPARPGDIITISGTVTGIETDTNQKIIDCEVLVSNQNKETVLAGETKVRVKNDENSC